MAERFTFWRNIKDSLDRISDKNDRLEAYEAIVEIGLTKDTSIIDNLSSTVQPLVQALVPTLERNYSGEQSDKGKMGGAPKKNSDFDFYQLITEMYEVNGKPPKKQELLDESIKRGAKSVSIRWLERNGFKQGEINDFCDILKQNCRDKTTNATDGFVANDEEKCDKTTNENVATVANQYDTRGF